MSKVFQRRRALLATAAVALVAASTSAQAGGFALREQSATGQGMSFAGMAAGGGDSISGMFWNPAVVNQVEHLQSEQHVTAIFASSDVNVSNATKQAIGFGGGVPRDGGDIGVPGFLSSGYNAYRVNEKIAVGLSITAPFGLATDPKHDWAGQVLNRSSRVLSINATPTVGYKVNEWFSVAAGVQIQWFDIRLRQATGIAANTPSATLRGDDVGVGFTAGFTITPSDWTSIGVGYRSHIKHKLKGEITLEGAPDPDINARVTLPETVSVGVRQKVSEQLTILGGVEWTNWSRLKEVRVKPVNRILPFHYKDGWFFSGGAEYEVSSALTIRGGVAYEKAPIDDDVRTPRLPDNNRWWLSTGASYKYNQKLSFDLGYSYVFVPGKSKIDIAAGPSNENPLPVGFRAKAKSDVHIISAAVRYKFGGDAPAVLVTKN